ncbi:LysR family transcriptional regulator [Actinoalloteichus hymeniacidonis]|uniref:Transcriptional regulator n=1 Tax=Actinoalloteichus hymeniacidonis TaxID=340345 RepID=A0AAC9MYJ9_9PSEU|nr:LysR family transcriptional regulator [Actinoalloteichus hymeniacidonis]AOS62986.1 transcriptional regulator [Actinoalloteichus hymeniacidonis]MBB5908979.1 DNA-binding transcriptional LysR family regulator [Actinoalloteichus hymeniacidonis]
MLDVRRMQILRAVVTSGSMTEAAANLGYTPSAVSQQIAALEREAGIVLLERVGRGVRPTAAGLLLTEHAAVISRDVAEAEAALAELRAGRTGRLVVRYFSTAGVALVPPALARLRREFPGVRVDLTLIDPADPLPDVERGDADLAVVVGGRTRPRDGVRLVPLHDDPYRAVLPRGHRLADKRVLDLADLADEPWVGTEWRAGRCLEIMLAACATAGFSPNFAVESDDYATAQGFVAAGLGVSLIPRLGLGTRHPGVVVRRVRKPEPIRSIYAAVREASATDPALRALIDALRAAAPE